MSVEAITVQTEVLLRTISEVRGALDIVSQAQQAKAAELEQKEQALLAQASDLVAREQSVGQREVAVAPGVEQFEAKAKEAKNLETALAVKEKAIDEKMAALVEFAQELEQKSKDLAKVKAALKVKA